MGAYLTMRKKSVQSPMLLIILLLLVIFLFGFEDITKEGVSYTCKARVISVEPPPPDTALKVINVLLVEKTPSAEVLEKGMYVLVTEDTIGGGTEKIISLEGTVVLIKGIKLLEKEDDQEVIVVVANSIERLD
jgi:hypothetical protein